MPRDSGGAGPDDPADDTELGMGIHAGRDETSVVLHLRPDLVDMAAAVQLRPRGAGRQRPRPLRRRRGFRLAVQ